MINVTELRPGNTYVWEGTPYTCLDIDLNKTAVVDYLCSNYEKFNWQ